MMHKILVIDDDESVRDAFCLALESQGYEIRTAESGEQGLEMAQDDCPDIVFLDIRMPGIDGVETMKRLREIYPDLNIYVVTAFYNDYLEQLSVLADNGMVFEIMQKPIGAEQIRSLAAGILLQPRII